MPVPAYSEQQRLSEFDGVHDALNAETMSGGDTTGRGLDEFNQMTYCCRHRGCDAEIPSNEFDSHDLTCPHQEVPCPFGHETDSSPRCDWTGMPFLLHSHMEISHGHEFGKPPELEFTSLKSGVVLVSQIGRKHAIISVRCEPPNSRYCLVMVDGNKRRPHKYELKLESEDRKRSVIFRYDTVPFDFSIESYRKNPEKAFVFNLETIKGLLGDSGKVFGRFVLYKKADKDSVIPRKEINLGYHSGPFINDKLLELLRCEWCSDYLTPPIYMCHAGKNYCQDCKPKMNCATYGEGVKEKRNFVLEKIAVFLDYPCTYERAGCREVLNCDNRQKHKQQCLYTPRKCFLKCSDMVHWNLRQHLKSDHFNSLVVPEEATVLKLVTDQAASYPLIYRDDVFELEVQYSSREEPLLVTLIQYGATKVNYRYEFQLLRGGGARKLSYTDECQLSSFWSRSYIQIPLDELSEYIVADKIFYKIYIRRNE